MLTHLSLFAGIGGLDLAAEWAGFETVGQVEWAPYPIKVLERHWPEVERWRDVRDFTAESFRERTGLRPGELTLITGGPPCQPFSIAGNRKASGDERDMWPEYFRVVGELRPRWCVAENVRGLLTAEDGRYFRGILRQFAELGYSVAWGIIRACDAGAPHSRERVCIVAYATCYGRTPSQITGGFIPRGDRCAPRTYEPEQPEGRCDRDGGRSCMADTESQLQDRPVSGPKQAGSGRFTDGGALEHARCVRGTAGTTSSPSGEKGHTAEFVNGSVPAKRELGDTMCRGRYGNDRRREYTEPADGHPRDRRPAQPGLGGLSDGISARMDAQRWPAAKGQPQHDWEPPRTGRGIPDRTERLKGDGNAVVPQQFYPVMAWIAEFEQEIAV